MIPAWTKRIYRKTGELYKLRFVAKEGEQAQDRRGRDSSTKAEVQSLRAFAITKNWIGVFNPNKI
jgi:hypothetical protein